MIVKNYAGQMYDQLASLPGGFDEALQFIITSADAGDENCLKFLQYLLEPVGEQAETLEEVCKLAGVDPFIVASVAVSRFEQDRVLRARIQAALRVDAIVQAAVNSALMPQGVADRKLLLTASGFLVEGSKAPTVVVDNRKVEVALPSLEDTLRLLDKAKPALLPAVDGEVVNVQPKDNQ